jgi:prophage regulatory protein
MSDRAAHTQNPGETLPAPIFLPRAEVERRVGLRRSAIYRRMQEGRFPQPVRDIDSASVWWLESEVDAWQRARIAARGQRETRARGNCHAAHTTSTSNNNGQRTRATGEAE